MLFSIKPPLCLRNMPQGLYESDRKTETKAMVVRAFPGLPVHAGAVPGQWFLTGVMLSLGTLGMFRDTCWLR